MTTPTTEPVVETKIVDRRELTYGSLDEIVSEAERAVSENASTLGNWSIAEILDHLGKTVTCTVDGFGFKAPLFFRIMGPFMKKGFLNKPMPAGFKLSGDSVAAIGPQETDSQDALDAFRIAIKRFQSATECVRHPFFGKMTYEECELLHRRHSALHMSFIDLK